MACLNSIRKGHQHTPRQTIVVMYLHPFIWWFFFSWRISWSVVISHIYATVKWRFWSCQVILLLMANQSTTTYLDKLTRSSLGLWLIWFLSNYFSTLCTHSPLNLHHLLLPSKLLMRNWLILINICICLDNNANSLFVNQGVKGWPVPTLKQLFSMAVTFNNKFKKGINLSWDNYQANKVTSCWLILHFSQKRSNSSELTCFLSGVFVDSSLDDSPICSHSFFCWH